MHLIPYHLSAGWLRFWNCMIWRKLSPLGCPARIVKTMIEMFLCGINSMPGFVPSSFSTVNFHNHIKQIAFVHAIWEFLDAMYLRITPRITLEVQLCRLDPTTSMSIHEHINKMQNLQQDILHARERNLVRRYGSHFT